jgi:hypothetical protein
MIPSESHRGSRAGLAVGLMALFGGLWLLLDSQGFGVPSFGKLWPTLFLLAALAALMDYLALGRRPSSAGWTVGWLGLGVLGFALTAHYTRWRRVLDWLPSFPTIAGLALWVTWLAGKRRSPQLFLAGGVLLVLGLLGFGARFDWLQRLLPSAQVIWAVLLLIGGGYLVARAVRRPKP